MKEYVFSGLPQQIGEQHGEILRDSIQKNFALYCDLWQKKLSELTPFVQGYKKSISTVAPHLALEIEAIAKSSNLHVDAIYALNSRSELLESFSINECTAIGLTPEKNTLQSLIMGQNWDWELGFRGLQNVIEIRSQNTPALKMFLEPGIIGKIGFNELGIGVCLNFLESKVSNHEGIPVHIMLRSILEKKSQQEIGDFISTVQRTTCANYLVGVEDSFVNYETTKEDVYKFYPVEGLIVHTNSFNALGEFCPRQEKMKSTLQKYCQQERKILMKEIKKLFTISGVEFLSTKKDEVGTLYTIIMNLSKKTMLVSDGAYGRRYQTFQLR